MAARHRLIVPADALAHASIAKASASISMNRRPMIPTGL
jgi:hypothetical protein